MRKNRKWLALILTGLLMTEGPVTTQVFASEEYAAETVDEYAEENTYDAGTEDAYSLEDTLLTEESVPEEYAAEEEPSGILEEEWEEEEIFSDEEELLTEKELPSGINDAYITTEMDYGAEAVEGIPYGDNLLLHAAAAPSYSPDIKKWIPVRNQNPYGNCWA